MKINSTLNGGVRNHVSILPALFPAIVFLMIGMNVRSSAVPPVMKVNPLVERVRQIYTSQIGIREKPSNSGPQVEKYLKYVGLGKGNPWCAAFVCWSLGKAGVYNPRSGWSPDLFAGKRVIWASSSLPVSSIKNQESRLGGVKLGELSLNTVDWIPTAVRCACPPLAGGRGGFRSFNLPSPSSEFQFQTSSRAYPPRLATDNWQLTTTPFSNKRPPPNPSTPTTGDIFGLYFPEKGRISHTGFIDQWDGTWMISVEGNTNIAGSREGDGVYRKRRLVKSVYQVARYIND
ncbi:hypothetical protein [Daejeonella lutea]|uniref:CHAP domain-containing protein n=1 Tax=Daejeonella lutea TaxID=572036 RepID=A0A1T5AYK7_9SPHI|nr:hypothetical protein [Daejeonella lutea]SKB40131.1 hypothetical protein SAMN05661099_1139 [Daejeonella lutea]